MKFSEAIPSQPGTSLRPPAIATALDGIDPGEWQEALEHANIPTLLMVLVHLTGDRGWLAPPYAPTRPAGMSDNPTGGLDDQTQAEIRRAVFEALEDLQRGQGEPLQEPDADLLLEMMRVCVGEQVPPEYLELMAEEIGIRSRATGWPVPPEPSLLRDFEVGIIGFGASGICTAVRLQEAGIPFTIYEKNLDLGGTWLENTYPGVRVDTPSHFYSFSFAEHDWPRYFAEGRDVHDYLLEVVERYGLREHIRFGSEVVQATYDAVHSRWNLDLRADGEPESASANIIVSATGQLNRPKLPALDGIDEFEGRSFHSARWPDDLSLDELRGMRVAVVGTGASAMQIIPQAATTAESLHIFQRSPQWAIPNENYFREYTGGERFLLQHLPFYRGWYRFLIAWIYGDRVHPSLKIDPDWPHPERAVNSTNDRHREHFTNYILEQLDGRPDLVQKCVPDYPPFGKRMLLDNGWFETLRHDHVTLHDDNLARFDRSGIETNDGEHVPVDVAIFATGFETLKLLFPMEIIGRGGKRLRDVWGDDDGFAYLGMTVPGFPNFFCLYGPNTNLGHGGSLVLLVEMQVRYLVSLVQQMLAARISAVDCREDVCDTYTSAVDAAHEGLVWTHSGMENWYRNSRGRVVTNSPWTYVQWWHMTQKASLLDYHCAREDEGRGQQ